MRRTSTRAPCARFANARLYHSEVTGLDLSAQRTVLCSNRPPVPYDVLSINIGSTPGMQACAGRRGACGAGQTRRWLPCPFRGGAWTRVLAAQADARASVSSARALAASSCCSSLHHRLTFAMCVRAGHRSIAGLSFRHRHAHGRRCLPSLPAGTRRALHDGVMHAARRRDPCQLQGDGPSRADAVVLNDTDACSAFDEIFWTTRAEAAPWLQAIPVSALDAGRLHPRRPHAAKCLTSRSLRRRRRTAAIDGYRPAQIRRLRRAQRPRR